jgi:hypothetical protein
MIKSIAVATRSAADVGYPAKCDHLLVQGSDLGDQFRLLGTNQRLVVALRVLVNGVRFCAPPISLNISSDFW